MIKLLKRLYFADPVSLFLNLKLDYVLSKTLVIVHTSQDKDNAKETANTLDFGSRLRNVELGKSTKTLLYRHSGVRFLLIF